MRRLCVLLISLAATLFAASPAWADTTVIVDDDLADCPKADFTTPAGIQLAVTAADPGTTILVCAGTYSAVTIPATKNDLQLLAKGAPSDVVVDADNALAGIHLAGVTGVTVRGFFVREGHEADILLTTAHANVIAQNLTTAAGHDGIQARLGSSGNVIEENVAFDNLAFNACGVNITSGSTGNLVRNNITTNNNWGLQVAGGASGNTLFGNSSFANRQYGARIIGAGTGNVVENNRTFDNAVFGIGIHATTGLLVARNHAFGNGTADLFTDTLAGNVFENNHCNTSAPPGLCDHDEGNGH